MQGRRAAAGLSAIACGLALSACWPVPGQNPDRTAHNASESALTTATVSGLEQRWDVASDGGHLVVSGNGLFRRVGAHGNSIERRNTATGVPVWTTTLPAGDFGMNEAGDPYVHDGRVLVGYGEAPLGGHYDGAALDLASGAIEETGLFSGRIESLRGDRVVTEQYGYGTGFPTVVSFGVEDVTGADDGRPGGPLGFLADGDPTFSLGQTAVYQSGNGPIGPDPATWTFGDAVRAFPLADGDADCGQQGSGFLLTCPTWITEVGGLPTAPVIGPDEAMVYVGTDAGRLVALDAATGAEQWSTAVPGGMSAPPALADGVLYAGTVGGGLLVVDAASGAVLWSAPAVGPVISQPAVAGSGATAVAYVGTFTGQVHALAAAGCGAATCVPLWTGTVTGAVTEGPVVTSGQVFVGTSSSRLVAFGLP